MAFPLKCIYHMIFLLIETFSVQVKSHTVFLKEAVKRAVSTLCEIHHTVNEDLGIDACRWRSTARRDQFFRTSA